jgi:hypothetical protein
VTTVRFLHSRWPTIRYGSTHSPYSNYCACQVTCRRTAQAWHHGRDSNCTSRGRQTETGTDASCTGIQHGKTQSVTATWVSCVLRTPKVFNNVYCSRIRGSQYSESVWICPSLQIHFYRKLFHGRQRREPPTSATAHRAHERGLPRR